MKMIGMRVRMRRKMKTWMKGLPLRPSEHKKQLDWTTIKQMT